MAGRAVAGRAVAGRAGLGLAGQGCRAGQASWGSNTCDVVALGCDTVLSYHNDRNKKRHARLQSYNQGSWKELGVVPAASA